MFKKIILISNNLKLSFELKNIWEYFDCQWQSMCDKAESVSKNYIQIISNFIKGNFGLWTYMQYAYKKFCFETSNFNFKIEAWFYLILNF